MKRHFIFISLFSILCAQHPGNLAVREGTDAFYNYEYEKSIKILTQARKDFPEHPGVHVAWVAAHWRYDEANLTIEEIYTNINRNLQEIVTVYDALVERYPDDQEYKLYQGAAKGLYARILLGQKKWFRTMVSAYQGFRIIQKAQEIDTTLTDAYLPIGIVEYFSGMSNVLVKVWAKMFGLVASREEGIRKMEVAATKSPWAWMETMSVLSTIYQFMEIDKKRGLEVSRTLTKKYPGNFDYRLHYALSLLQTNDLKRGEKELNILKQQLEKLWPRHQKLFTSYLNYLWGYYFFLIGNDEKAMGFLNQCINFYYAELDAFLANAYLLKGMILDKQKDRMGAVIAYKKCIKLDNHTQAINLAEQYLDDPFQG